MYFLVLLLFIREVAECAARGLQKHGIPAAQQRLIFLGRKLSDEKTIEEESIVPDHPVTMIVFQDTSLV
jgi:hypothetical protein